MLDEVAVLEDVMIFPTLVVKIAVVYVLDAAVVMKFVVVVVADVVVVIGMFEMHLLVIRVRSRPSGGDLATLMLTSKLCSIPLGSLSRLN